MIPRLLWGDVYLNADGTSAEIAHRAVCTGGEIIQKGLLIGKAMCHAHVDCSPSGSISDGARYGRTRSNLYDHKGGLDADIKGLGPELDRRIMEIAELSGHGEE